MKHVKFAFILFSILLITKNSYSQNQPDSTLLSVERIFSSQEFFGRGFGGAKWLTVKGGYTTLAPSKTVKNGRDIILTKLDGGTKDTLVPASMFVPKGKTEAISIEGYDWSEDFNLLLIYTKSERVWRQNTRGDYWVLNIKTGELNKLGGDAKPSTLMFAQFSPDLKRVGYVRENNIFIEDITTNKITQLTYDGSHTIINGTFDWVYEEELGLRDGFKWSPDGKKIAYWQLDASGVRDFTMINNTDSLYSYTIPIQYPKAGETNSAGKVGVIDLSNISDSKPSTTWMKLEGDPRNNYIARMSWTGNSKELMLQYFNRLQTHLQVLLATASNGAFRILIDQKDSVWFDVVDNHKWTLDGENLLWVCEDDGWKHLYSVSRKDGYKKLITKGNYDIMDVLNIDMETGYVYFTASPNNATQKYLFRTKLDGYGELEKVTPSEFNGINNYTISPDAKWAFHRYSNFSTPSVTTLISLPGHKKIRILSENPQIAQKLNSLQKGKSEFFKVKTNDGTELDGWAMYPPDFHASKKYPVLFYVYGEPGSQTVTDAYTSTQYLWHLMLTQKGFVVMSLDNRGTPAPKGKTFRKAIYRKIGVLSSSDQAEAVKNLIARHNWIDESRISIWGWSGGGSSSLNAIFRYPNVYKTAMSVAPVTDLRYYDSIYEERYMGLPAENSNDYFQGSPINFAGGLKGNLLLIHGTGDDNVHFQNSEALVNKLIEKNKVFTFMPYPNRTHGIYEGQGTYLHLYNLLTRYILEKNGMN